MGVNKVFSNQFGISGLLETWTMLDDVYGTPFLGVLSGCPQLRLWRHDDWISIFGWTLPLRPGLTFSPEVFSGPILDEPLKNKELLQIQGQLELVWIDRRIMRPDPNCGRAEPTQGERTATLAGSSTNEQAAVVETSSSTWHFFTFMLSFCLKKHISLMVMMTTVVNCHLWSFLELDTWHKSPPEYHSGPTQLISSLGAQWILYAGLIYECVMRRLYHYSIHFPSPSSS